MNVSWPAWLRMAVLLFPTALGLVAAVMLLFSLARDWVGKPGDEAAGGTNPNRRGLIRDALHLGSPFWSMCFVLVSAVGYSLSQISGFPLWLRVACALTPLAPLVMYLRSINRDTAAIDELALLVRREAYGFVFCAMIGILVCVWLLEKAGVLSGFNWDSTHLVVLMFALLVIGATISSRRFR
jgi:uncharacterized membrane protein YhdT